MKEICHGSTLTTFFIITIALAACNTEDLPGFVDSRHISKVVLASKMSARTSTATPAKDNVNELLNMLHLSDVTAGSRTRATRPATPGYSVVLYNGDRAVLKVLIPGSREATWIYLQDNTNSKRTGSYSLKHAIVSADLQGFIAKYPGPTK